MAFSKVSTLGELTIVVVGVSAFAGLLYKSRANATQHARFEAYGLHDLPTQLKENKALLEEDSNSIVRIRCPSHGCVSKLSGYFKYRGYVDPNVALPQIGYKYDKYLRTAGKPNIYIHAPNSPSVPPSCLPKD